MDVLEKTIKGLECCLHFQNCAEKCPYDNDSDDIYECTSALAKDALELLKEPRITKDEIIDSIATARGYKGRTEEFIQRIMKTGDGFETGIWFAIRVIRNLFEKNQEE